jgi:TetR/AcrR family transcriptional regulator, tetracycline repressor protein
MGSSRAPPRAVVHFGVPSAARAAEKARPRGERAPWGSISRAQVIDAAVKAVRAEGYEHMTIRSLAADLGVAPMSLYRHVRDKDDLLGEVVDRMLSRAWRPRAPESDWRAYVAEANEKLRRFLVAQPAALHVFLRHPVVTPAARHRMATVISVLEHGGVPGEQAPRAYATLHTYTIGFAALQSSRQRAERQRRGGARNELAEQLAAFASVEQFGVGLRYLIEGIERDLSA